MLISLNVFATASIKSESGIFAFVGEQVDFYQFEPTVSDDVILMDEAFKAKYKILEQVHGEFNSDVISFEVYDHYGTPAFSRYKYVLLFVSEHDGKIYHEKYQFFDVYKTKSGGWAYCGTPFEYEEAVKPKPLENIEFSPRIEYSTVMYNEAYAKEVFPEPAFEHANGKAICRQGVYVDELFRIKQAGVLKNRGHSAKPASKTLSR
ncbi:hypothetical protein CWB99_20605 [Pseudoalteromonas rubra]|uniref:Uncharacterized protein n=2 Tax=Pseudoalteromonas rubra TaxID=43658 RepID=A0A5S3WG16_9GAMM|nr:hypothetical protein CWB99_20605 [Pseudoalteromonas rubra]TMP31011.1 hypothetical protein CWC00_15530 [Pseudoalteromonas rubra]